MLYLVSTWVHILAATVWIGGTVFIALVLVPVSRHRDLRGSAATLVQLTARRFRWVAWIGLGLLLLTGTVNVFSRGFLLADVLSASFWATSFGRALSVKLVLVGLILALSAVHDFVIGPRATIIWQGNPDSVAAHRVRRQATWIARLNLLLTLMVVAVGVVLVRGVPW